jgi:heptosyltransferase-2/heptosyltransferase-3
MPGTLVCYFARVGDLVMFTPVLKALAAQGPLELCARPWARTLLGSEPYLATIHTIDKPNAPWWQELLAGRPRRSLTATLQSRGYDRIVMLDRETPGIAAWIRSFAGSVPVQVLPHIAQGTACHLVDANIAACEAAGVPVADRAPTLTVPEAARTAARARLAALGARVVAVQAGSSLTSRWLRRQPNLKGLTAEQWAQLCGGLLAEGRADACAFLGSAPEGREARTIIAAMPPAARARCHDLTGAVPLSELPALLSVCCGCLSVDTGPAHIAAAVGCPLLTVFGPSDPARFMPRGPGRIAIVEGAAPCRPCLGTKRFRTCRDNICLRLLPAARLAAEAEALLSRPGPAPPPGAASQPD